LAGDFLRRTHPDITLRPVCDEQTGRSLFERRNMPHLHLIGVRPELCGVIVHSGLHAHCLGCVMADEGLMYLSAVGYRTAVRGIWAALMENQALELGGRERELIRRAAGRYFHHTVALPDLGYDHMLLIHAQATLKGLEPGKAFCVLSESREPPLRRFALMLDKAVLAPVLPDWAGHLWKEGKRRGLITPAENARGTHAWLVAADDEQWLELIGYGIEDQELMT